MIRRAAVVSGVIGAVASFGLFATSANAQPFSIAFVGGIATAETSAEHSTLITARIEAQTTRLRMPDGWSVRGIGGAGWQPLFTMQETTPVYREGLAISGGVRIAHASARIETAIVGKAGTTRVDSSLDWTGFFEGGISFRWIAPLVDVYAGARHDNRLSRTGALSSYRDPTGRLLLSVNVFPIRRGPLAIGAGIESETAMPGTGRLPSGLLIGFLCRFRVPST